MRTVSAILLLSFALSLSAGAANVYTQSCPVAANDPFATELRMPAGPYRGRCINSDHYRSVRSLTPAELAAFNLNEDEDTMVLANFRHQGKFWLAEIPLKSIQRVEFQKMSLKRGLPLYHGQLRYVLDGAPVRLTAQERNSARRVSFELREKSGRPQDFVVALYGVRDLEHDQDAFNPSMGLGILGVKSKYAISYAFQSLYDGAQWTLENRLPVKQFVLALDRGQQLAVLARARSIGDQRGVSEMYNVLTNNCLNFVFTLLNDVVLGPNLRRTGRLHETRAPLGSLKTLGLIKHKTPSSDLAREFPTGIELIAPTDAPLP